MCSRRRIVLEGVHIYQELLTQMPAKLRCPDRAGNFETGEKKRLCDLQGQRGVERDLDSGNAGGIGQGQIVLSINGYGGDDFDLALPLSLSPQRGTCSPGRTHRAGR